MSPEKRAISLIAKYVTNRVSQIFTRSDAFKTKKRKVTMFLEKTTDAARAETALPTNTDDWHGDQILGNLEQSTGTSINSHYSARSCSFKISLHAISCLLSIYVISLGPSLQLQVHQQGIK